MNFHDWHARTARVTIALDDMGREAQRALDKHGPEQTMDAVDKTNGERLAILVEEVGEVAKELTYDQQGVRLERGTPERGATHYELEDDDGRLYLTHPIAENLLVSDLDDERLVYLGFKRTTAKQRLRKELVQVGAMAATWIAALDAEQ